MNQQPPTLSVVPAAIETYAAAHCTPLPALLQELAAATHEHIPDRVHMLSGQMEGTFLQILLGSMSARRVLEIGTFTGMSALMMAAVLPIDGRVITCDVDPVALAIARGFFARSPHGGTIEIREGPALETMRRLDGPFDLVFIDADKENYVAYYEAALPLPGPNGVIVVDNVLWSGRVLNPREERDHAIVAFNDHVQRDPRVTNVILTVRDGVMLIRRQEDV